MVGNNSTGSEEPPSVRRAKWKMVLVAEPIILVILALVWLSPPFKPWRSLILSVLATAVLALYVVLHFWEQGIRKRVAAGEECANCRYNLYGLPDTVIRCPECGWRR